MPSISFEFDKPTYTFVTTDEALSGPGETRIKLSGKSQLYPVDKVIQALSNVNYPVDKFYPPDKSFIHRIVLIRALSNRGLVNRTSVLLA